MIELLKDYKYWKSQLTPNFGSEDCGEEVMWNDGIQSILWGLLKNVDSQIAHMIRNGYI